MCYHFDPTLQVLFIIVSYVDDIIHKTFSSAIIWSYFGVFSPNTRRDIQSCFILPYMDGIHGVKRKRDLSCHEVVCFEI